MKSSLFNGCLFIFYVLINSGILLGEPNGEKSIKRLTTGDDSITDDTIRKLMEKMSEILGPTQSITNNSISLSEENLSLQASIWNGRINGPGIFTITEAHVNMTTLEFFVGLFHNSLSINGLYDVLFDNEYVHLTGSDAFSISIANLSTHLYLKLNLTAQKTLQMEDLKLDYNTSANVEFKNLGGSQKVSDRLNNLINYLLPVTITSTKEKVGEEVKKIAFPKVQFLIGGMTVDQFIQFVKSIVGSKENDYSTRRLVNCLFVGSCSS